MSLTEFYGKEQRHMSMTPTERFNQSLGPTAKYGPVSQYFPVRF